MFRIREVCVVGHMLLCFCRNEASHIPPLGQIRETRQREKRGTEQETASLHLDAHALVRHWSK